MMVWPFRAILLVGVLALAGLSAESGTLQVGAAKIDITPSADAALAMSGYADRKEGFKGIHDHIYARAIVVSDDAKLAAIVTCADGRVGGVVTTHRSRNGHSRRVPVDRCSA